MSLSLQTYDVIFVLTLLLYWIPKSRRRIPRGRPFQAKDVFGPFAPPPLQTYDMICVLTLLLYWIPKSRRRLPRKCCRLVC